MFLTLLKLRIRAMLSSFTSRNKKNKKLSPLAIVGFVILFLYLVIVFGGLFFSILLVIATSFIPMGIGWVYFAVAGILSFILCFIGSVFATQSQLYDSNDNEFLLSMPVKPSAILASRICSLMIFNYIYTAVVMVPAFIGYFMFFPVSFIGVLGLILLFILIPLLSQTLSCFIGWIIALVSSKMRNKNLITTALSLIFFIAYFFIISELPDYITGLAENGLGIAETIKSAFYPLYCIGTGITDGNILNLLIFVLCTLVPFAIVYFILSKNYIKIVTSSRGASRKKYISKDLKGNSASSSLTRLAIKRFISNPLYIMNAGTGSIMALILSVFAAVKAPSVSSLFGDFGLSGLNLPVMLAAAMGFCFSMNQFTSSSVSVEAKTLWLIKSLPVSSLSFLMSKVKAHIITSVIPLIPAVMICGISGKASVLGYVSLIVYPLSFIVMTAFLGLIINLRFPKFDWLSEIQAVKQGMSVVIAMFSSMAIAVIPIIVTVIASAFMPAEIALLLMAFILFIVSLLLYFALRSYGTRKFEEL